MPVQVVEMKRFAEGSESQGRGYVNIRLCNEYDFSGIYNNTGTEGLNPFVDEKLRQYLQNVYTVADTDQKFDELRTSTSGKLSEISHHLDARDSEVMAIMKSEDERVASQLTSFIREEVQRVVKSLQKLSPSEAEDLFG